MRANDDADESSPVYPATNEMAALKRQLADVKSQLVAVKEDRDRRRNKKPKLEISNCRDYNNEKGCSNPPSDVGCARGNRKFRHGCNRKLPDGSYCNDTDHNRHTHPN